MVVPLAGSVVARGSRPVGISFPAQQCVEQDADELWSATLAAVRAGKRVFLANKEALVMTGRLLMDEVRSAGAELIPIDSEHNAIFQCMPAGYLPGDPALGQRPRR